MRPLQLVPLLALALPLNAQEIEDPGPYPVGFVDATFPATLGTAQGRIFYPALSAGAGATPDPGSGPYPLVGFLHGWLGVPEIYSELSTHIASWGFVVASIGTETGFGGTMQPEAQDTADMLNWLDAESDDAQSFYAGLVSDDPWSAAGHSMGGGALFYLIEDEPKVRTVVALQPWKGGSLGGSAGGSANLSTWDGDALILAGSVDTTCPVATMTFPYFQLCQETGRAVHVEVEGMGHLGPTDVPGFGEPMAPDEQQRLHRRFVTGFLRAEVKGEEELYIDLLGEGAAVEPVTLDARFADPLHWAAPSELSASTSAIGLAGVPGDLAAAAFSLAPAAIPTAFGLLGIDPAQGAVLYQLTVQPDGVFEAPIPTPVGSVGVTIYTQAVVLGSGGGFTAVRPLVLP
ncbi:MAG: hypothetical protein AAF682_22005 [Planctomycetota bacterium]